MKPCIILIFFSLVLNLNQMKSQNARIHKQMNAKNTSIIHKGDTILIGYACNRKDGACISTSDETCNNISDFVKWDEASYYIYDLASWNKMYLGKKIIVSGSLEFVIIKKKPINEEFITPQDIYFEEDSLIHKRIRNAIWRLYKE